MKTIKVTKVWAAALIIVVLIAVIGGGAFLIYRQQSNPNQVVLELSSNPFPITVGQTTMRVALRNSDGTPIEGATIQIDGVMDEPDHGYMIPVSGRSSIMTEGEYIIPVTWSMMGRWAVTVTADLPDERPDVTEYYSLMAYQVPQIIRGGSLEARYKSERELAMSVSTNEEFRIVIPMGTQEQIMESRGDEIIPSTIRLSLSGQRILVIENNDVADHIIGPFFVRSGETLRQEFTSPAEFVGACSFRHDASVSIIVQ